MNYLVAIMLAVLFISSCGQSSKDDAVAPVQAQVKAPEQDGCTVDSSSLLVNQHKVSNILNLVKVKEELGASGRCTVNFDLIVDGQTYHLEETEEGLEQLESLCYYARERARKSLLLDLGGEFKTESSVSCKFNER